MQTRGKGVRNPKVLRTSYVEAPLWLQCGTSTWFKHFATFSGLDEECVRHLSTGDYRLRVRTLLRVEGPKIFHVDEFTRRNGLFTFTFVRHPFER